MNEPFIILEKLLNTHDWSYEGWAEWNAINLEQKRLIESGLVTAEEVIELTHKYASKS